MHQFSCSKTSSPTIHHIYYYHVDVYCGRYWVRRDVMSSTIARFRVIARKGMQTASPVVRPGSVAFPGSAASGKVRCQVSRYEAPLPSPARSVDAGQLAALRRAEENGASRLSPRAPAPTRYTFLQGRNFKVLIGGRVQRRTQTHLHRISFLSEFSRFILKMLVNEKK